MQANSTKTISGYKGVLVFFLLTDLILCLLSSGFPFFWDSILTSTIAQYFYQNGAGNLVIPLQWDAGHPPFFPLYIQFFWKILGKSLWVSHLAVLPFLWLKTWSAWSITKATGYSKNQTIAVLIGMLLSPAILTQSLMVSYDTTMLAGFLLALSGIIHKSSLRTIIGTCLLVLLSVRGMQYAVIIIAVFITYSAGVFNERAVATRALLIFLPAYLLAFAWHYYHYTQTGWAIISPSESWSGHRDISGLSALPGQGFALFRSVVEQGMIVLWTLWVFSLMYRNKASKQIFNISIIATLIAGFLPFLFFSSPILARYTLILQALLIIAICGASFPYKKWLLPFAGIFLFSGHCWLYRGGKSNSWETTLAHVPYFSMREKALDYLQENEIPGNQVGAHFPLYTSRAQTNLEKDSIRLSDLNSSSPGHFRYVLVSGYNNDFGKGEKEKIRKTMIPDTTFNCCGQYISIYRNPSTATH